METFGWSLVISCIVIATLALLGICYCIFKCCCDDTPKRLQPDWRDLESVAEERKPAKTVGRVTPSTLSTQSYQSRLNTYRPPTSHYSAPSFGSYSTPHGRSQEDVDVDLHGKGRQKALAKVKETLKNYECPSFITGRGKHSRGKIPVLKPAVLRHLDDEGIGYEMVNDGMVRVTYRPDY